MFDETDKKFIESFFETKNQNSVVLHRTVADGVVSKAFYRFGLS